MQPLPVYFSNLINILSWEENPVLPFMPCGSMFKCTSSFPHCQVSIMRFCLHVSLPDKFTCHSWIDSRPRPWYLHSELSVCSWRVQFYVSAFSLAVLAGTAETTEGLFLGKQIKDPQGFNKAIFFLSMQLKVGETAAVIARELAEQTKRNLQPGDISYTVKAMVQLVDLLDVQLRNLTPGGKDSAARSLNKVGDVRARAVKVVVTTKRFKCQTRTRFKVPIQWGFIGVIAIFTHVFVFCFCFCFFALICFTSCFPCAAFSPPSGFLLTWKSLDLRGVGANSTEMIIPFTFPFVSLPEPWANLFICKRAQC